MLANLIERLRDKRPLRRRQLTKRVALNMLPALLTVALLLWAFAEQFFVLLPFVSANGSTLPVYKGAPKLHAAGMVLVFGTAWALVVAHFVRVVITDNNPATNPPCSQLPQSCLACRRCHGNKPDRCHHCSACNLCCLKMDHHCLRLFLATTDTQTLVLCFDLIGCADEQVRGWGAVWGSTTTSFLSCFSCGRC